MKDASGASQMDAKTQVTSLHGVSMLRRRAVPVEANIGLALLHEPGGDNDRALVNVAVGARDQSARHAGAGRGAGRARGRQRAQCGAGRGGQHRRPAAHGASAPGARRLLIERFAAAGLVDALDETFDLVESSTSRDARSLLGIEPDPRAAGDARRPARRGARIGVRALPSTACRGHPTADAVLAAITATLAWGPLHAQAHLAAHRREPAVVDAPVRHADRRFGRGRRGTSRPLLRHPDERHPGPAARRPRSRSSRCSAARRSDGDLFAFQTLVGLLLTNGPGAISAQGAKGAVSADGPETPERVQLNKALVGFLTHTGYAHGGNGYEGIAFLLEQFDDSGPRRSRRPEPRHRPASAGDALRRGSTRATSRRKKTRGQPRHPEDPGRQPPGVQGQAGQPRPARSVHPEAVRASAASTTSSTTTTARWCRRCSRPACRAPSTASTSMR